MKRLEISKVETNLMKFFVHERELIIPSNLFGYKPICLHNSSMSLPIECMVGDRVFLLSAWANYLKIRESNSIAFNTLPYAFGGLCHG